MKRRTFFGFGLALAASIPALAQSVKHPLNEEMFRYLYIETLRFDGWNIDPQYFRIKVNRFPVGTEKDFIWEYAIPYKLLHQADFIQVVDGKVLKDRRGRGHLRDPIEIYYAPLRDNDWLIEQGYRFASNESYTSIG